MDVVWVVLDALAFAATPFAPGGPDTMPRLASLAADRGRVFTRAYAPGTASPSSHAAMFTGRLPSRVGTHEARPSFDADVPTVGDVLGTDRPSLLVSYNPFLFTGLERGFGTCDDLRGRRYTVFDGAADPRRYLVEHRDTPPLRRALAFIAESDYPLRAAVNGLSFKLWSRYAERGRPERIAGERAAHQHAGQVVDRVRRFREAADDDVFVVANYMDVHPPLDASDRALDAVAPDFAGTDLPTGRTSDEVRRRVAAGDDRHGEAMAALYRAAVWDLDRTVTPLVSDVVADGGFVVVTADHGTRFTPHHPLADRRVRVPLVVFAPGGPTDTVDHTVDLRSLPATTMAALGRDPGPFAAPDLRAVDDDRTAVTEYVHEGDPDGDAAFGGFDSVAYDLAVREGDAVVESRDGELRAAGPDASVVDRLRRTAAALRRSGVESDPEPPQYDAATERRLSALGYR